MRIQQFHSYFFLSIFLTKPDTCYPVSIQKSMLQMLANKMLKESADVTQDSIFSLDKRMLLY